MAEYWPCSRADYHCPTESTHRRTLSVCTPSPASWPHFADASAAAAADKTAPSAHFRRPPSAADGIQAQPALLDVVAVPAAASSDAQWFVGIAAGSCIAYGLVWPDYLDPNTVAVDPTHHSAVIHWLLCIPTASEWCSECWDPCALAHSRNRIENRGWTAYSGSESRYAATVSVASSSQADCPATKPAPMSEPLTSAHRRPDSGSRSCHQHLVRAPRSDHHLHPMDMRAASLSFDVNDIAHSNGTVHCAGCQWSMVHWWAAAAVAPAGPHTTTGSAAPIVPNTFSYAHGWAVDRLTCNWIQPQAHRPPIIRIRHANRNTGRHARPCIHPRSRIRTANLRKQQMEQKRKKMDMELVCVKVEVIYRFHYFCYNIRDFFNAISILIIMKVFCRRIWISVSQEENVNCNECWSWWTKGVSPYELMHPWESVFRNWNSFDLHPTFQWIWNFAIA